MISDISGLPAPPSPALAILNVRIERFPSDSSTIVTHILLAARSLVAQKWKSNIVPQVSDVIDRVKTTFEYERLIAHKAGRGARFDKEWSKWSSWIKGKI